MSPMESFATHAVTNQPQPLGRYNAYLSDVALREAVHREGGGWAEGQLAAYGEIAGGELMELGYTANENKPKFKPFDRYGRRIDEVEFHPAYHRVMQLGMQHGVHAFAWRHADMPGAHVARAALAYLHGQAEAGTSCPLTMTHASAPALRHEPALAAQWLDRVHSLDYDPRVLPAEQKNGCTMGMGMTEKQGGSDVRANTTRAHAQADGSYALVGHKWFYSAPMCDAHLVLARLADDAPPTCFLVPRLAPDGMLNGVRIQRLKDKLGDGSNASAEVEFVGAHALRVGGEGRGIATILEMVALTRLDCMIGSAALMRQALVQALHHCEHRKAFGKFLIEQPLMRNVLADLALEAEAAIALTLRVARAVDAAPRDAQEAALARIATAIGKFWICKRCVPAVNEAQECLGGIGYVEDTSLPRLYRQAPLNSIWEGSGNIQALDVLRALGREPQTRDALFAELDATSGEHRALASATARLRAALDEAAVLEVQARRIVEQMALCLQAATLLRSGHGAVADAFCASRLDGDHGHSFGSLSARVPIAELIERARLAA